MLTSLEIENFKGIAARQRIDFAPLTLLFGANSAGKSTILQALLYLHEILERGDADVDRTELGGSVLELGGFARLVHRHEADRAIVIRAEFATPGGLDRFGRGLAGFPFADLDDEVDSAWLELTVRFRATSNFRGPVVDGVRLGVNQHANPLVWLGLGPNLREGEPLFVRVNTKHPMLSSLDQGDVADWSSVAVRQWGQKSLFPSDAELGVPGSLQAEDDPSLPVFAVSRSWRSALPSFRDPLRVLVPSGDEPSRSEQDALEQVRNFLEMVVLGTAAQLAAFLRQSLYIGPLRVIPQVGDLYERPSAASSWGDGLAAWQALLVDRTVLVNETNEWLQRLGADCRVAVTSVFEPSSSAGDAENARVHTLRLETPSRTRLIPSEVGAGISQLIPVLVAALQDRPGLLAIEQPELHVHPALQVGLGDLFIDAISRMGSRRIVLVETHSEHLILRLLRRIRETTDGKPSENAPSFSLERIRVIYVENNAGGVNIRQLRVDEQGEFVDRWPKGFFAERMEEL